MSAEAPTDPGPPHPLAQPALQVLVLLGVCALVYWLGLGTGGFHSTEAHRAIPAYEMLDHARGLDDWLVPRMFEQPYLRKPPGMPWAIALASALLGETVFAARAVSALACTAMALLAFCFARRWFGPRAALPSGLACALMPVLWESGRAAEIEALNNLGTMLAALFLIDALVFARSMRTKAMSAIIASLGIVWFALAKGPASAPVVLGIVAVVCVQRRSLRPLGGALWVTLVPALVVVGALFWLIARAASVQPQPPVTQSPSAFMFEPGMLVGVLTLPFAAFGSMLPASFALLFPWGPDARTEANRDHPDWTPDRFSLARTLALAWLLAVLVFMLFGVRNPRYTLPAACLLPPLAGAYLSGLGSWLVPTRNRIARVLTLGRPAVLVLALLIGAFVYVRTIEANRRATSATPVGAHIADALGPFLGTTDRPVTVIADDAIEARPELLLALERSARAAGHDLRVRWIPGFGGELPADLPDGPVLALLRVDPESPEAGIPERSAPWFQPPAGLKDPGPWRFHKYSAGIYLISLDPFAD